MRILDIPKLLRNAKGYLNSQNIRGTQRDCKNKKSHVNCFITYMFTGLLFTTEDIKKGEVQVPRNEYLVYTVLGFVSIDEEYNPE